MWHHKSVTLLSGVMERHTLICTICTHYFVTSPFALQDLEARGLGDRVDTHMLLLDTHCWECCIYKHQGRLSLLGPWFQTILSGYCEMTANTWVLGDTVPRHTLYGCGILMSCFEKRGLPSPLARRRALPSMHKYIAATSIASTNRLVPAAQSVH